MVSYIINAFSKNERAMAGSHVDTHELFFFSDSTHLQFCHFVINYRVIDKSGESGHFNTSFDVWRCCF